MKARFELLLRGGRVIDPGQGLDGHFDVAITGGCISTVQPNIAPDLADESIDVRGKLVLPGMIDPHAHVFRHFSGVLGMDADWVGIQSGVTTLIEQGSVGAGTLPAYLKYVVEAKANRVFVFLAPYLAGAAGGFIKEHFTPDTIDVDLTMRAFADHPQIVRGLKFWAEQILLRKYGLESLERTARIARAANVPIYVHIGELWRASDEDHRAVPAESVLESIMPLLRPGDIFAHPYTSQAGGYFDRQGKVRPIVKEALARGMHLDLGYGAATSFRLLRAGIDQGFVPETLGADIQATNTIVPDPAINPRKLGRFRAQPSVTNGMNLLMACGLALEQVVPMATSNPARIFLRLPHEPGTLRPGVVADVSVLHDERGRWRLYDNLGDHVDTERLLRPAFCLRGGIRYDADSPLLPVVESVEAA